MRKPTTLPWASLKTKNRCKDIGVPWSDEDNHAIRELKIPADYVRDGIVTLKAYETALKKEEDKGAPLNRKPMVELEKLAKGLKIDFTAETPRDVLANLIKVEESKLKVVKNNKGATEREDKIRESQKKKDAKKAKEVKEKRETKLKNVAARTIPEGKHSTAKESKSKK